MGKWPITEDYDEYWREAGVGDIWGLRRRLRLSYARNSRNPRATRVPIEQPRSLEHVTILDLD